ncbi:MAG TPA: triose-phosphate isomerase [bacterium]
MGSGWKMNKTVKEAREYAARLADYLAGHPARARIFVVPPFTALQTVGQVLKDSGVIVGAQNMHWSDGGAFTGEISPGMLRDVGVSLVELGHSERRAQFGETDETVNRKVLAAFQHTLRPLVCVGETAVERDGNVGNDAVIRQVTIALRDVPEDRVQDVMFAYEPVWAIGESGTPAEPAYANAMHGVIQTAVGQAYGDRIASAVAVLYGGSVEPGNVAAFARQPLIDGLFIGRASWDVTSFITCIQAFEGARRGGQRLEATGSP